MRVGAVRTDRPLRNLLLYSAAHNGRATVVMRGGEIIAEAYHNGFPKGQLWWLRSGGKSYSGAIAAKLIHEGLLESYDVPVSDIVPAFTGDATVRQVLSLQSGVQMVGGATLLTYEQALALPVNPAQLGTFEYGSSNFWIFGAVVAALQAQSPSRFLRDEILTPIGAAAPVWDFLKPFPDLTQPNLAGGAATDILSWAKFGDLLLREGETTDGQEIIASELLSELTQPSAGYHAYGMTFWLTMDDIDRAVNVQADPAKAIPNGYAAIGFENQILAIRRPNTVVARIGDTDTTFNEEEFFTLIDRL